METRLNATNVLRLTSHGTPCFPTS